MANTTGTTKDGQMEEEGNVVTRAAGQAADALATVRDRLPDADTVRQGLQNPIGIVIGAAAVGFLVGLVVPITDYEREKLRPIADDLAEQASAARDELVEHGRSALTETAAAAQESVQQHARELTSSLTGGTEVS